MVGWHHRLDGPDFEQTLGVGDGQGSLVCCSPRGCSRTRLRDLTTTTTELPEAAEKVTGSAGVSPHAQHVFEATTNSCR